METQAIVHIVDDDAAMRQALCLLLESEGLHATAYASAEEFLEQISETSRGCILLDVRMPGLSGLELQQYLNKKQIELPIIVMTGYADVSMAVQAMKAGAVDFIEKPFDNEHLLQQIHVSLQKNARTQSEQVRHRAAKEKTERLTRREHQVMEMLVQGHQNRVIAEKLGISSRTVEIHRAHVMEKLEARSLSEVVRISLMAASAQGDVSV